jgi:RNA polymerase sigma-70 factor (ECF subfamily)
MMKVNTESITEAKPAIMAAASRSLTGAPKIHETDPPVGVEREPVGAERIVRAYCGDREVASDAVSEAFAQVLAREAAVRDPRSWLWRSAFRIAAGQLKAGSPGLGTIGHPTYEMPEPVVEVLQALRTLSPRQRAAVVLHDYADLPTKDVAKIMGVGQATVRVHLSQARRRLRRVLEEPDA